jgi:hypothetical protein
MKITRAFDNRPMSFRGEALFHSISEVKPCLAATIHPTILKLHPRFRARDYLGKSRSGGGADSASADNFSNSMTTCSMISAYRGLQLKKRAGPACT